MFTKQVPKYWSNDEHAAFVSFIASNPEAGAVVPHSGGVRKVRWSMSGQGEGGTGLMNKHQQWEEGRNLGEELLTSVKQMKAGQAVKEHKIAVSQAVEARLATGLSQSTFAQLIGVSKRTLQEWEQGRRTPSGAAAALLKIAVAHPDILREL